MRFWRRCGRLWCRARLGSTGFRRRFRGFGAEPGQVQQGSREGSGEGLGGFGAQPGQVQQDLRPFNAETQLRCLQRLASQHASERSVKIKRCVSLWTRLLRPWKRSGKGSWKMLKRLLPVKCWTGWGRGYSVTPDCAQLKPAWTSIWRFNPLWPRPSQEMVIGCGWLPTVKLRVDTSPLELEGLHRLQILVGPRVAYTNLGLLLLPRAGGDGVSRMQVWQSGGQTSQAGREGVSMVLVSMPEG